MKGTYKRFLCGILAAVTVLAAPTAAQAQKLDTAKIAKEIEESYVPVRSNKQVDTKAKTVTLYAGLLYRFRAEGFKEAKATWKISNPELAALEIGKRNEKIGAAVVRTKKAGKFTITAVQGKKKYTYKVTVKNVWQRRRLKTEERKENRAPKTLVWESMPGADGYVVYRRYQSEDGSPENGWRDGQIEVLKVFKGKKATSYDIREEGNWDIFWRLGWGWNAKAYKMVNGKMYLSATCEDDAYYNIVKLK